MDRSLRGDCRGPGRATWHGAAEREIFPLEATTCVLCAVLTPGTCGLRDSPRISMDAAPAPQAGTICNGMLLLGLALRVFLRNLPCVNQVQSHRFRAS